MNGNILRNAQDRITGLNLGILWRPRLSSPDNPLFIQYDDMLRDMLNYDTSPCWRGVDDVAFLIEVQDISEVDERPDGTLNYRPLCIIERPDRMPLILYLKPVLPFDDKFTVYVEAVPPSVADTLDHRFSDGPEYHYLLHEIAFRVGMSMCYESADFDNETVKMLMCVEDNKKYKTDIDIQTYETRNDPILMCGLGEINPFVHGVTLNENQVQLDALMFLHSQEESSTDVQDESDDAIEKVVSYKDIRPIQEFGKDDWWVEMIRCPNCNQRVKVSLSKAQCPDGLPAVKVACKSCKLSFSHL